MLGGEFDTEQLRSCVPMRTYDRWYKYNDYLNTHDNQEQAIRKREIGGFTPAGRQNQI